MNELLELKNLSVEYKSIKDDVKSTTVAVDDVSLKIFEGEIYALAGESGCGKSTLAKSITKLVPVKSGEIIFLDKNILKHNATEKKGYPKCVQMVFQNPYSSLNPKMKVRQILQEPLDINTNLKQSEKEAQIEKVLSDVGLSKECLNLYPHEFSGGQRQRIAIARALILNPKLIIADEPVSALDASIQAQIINLFKELRLKRNLAILFISHDMNVIKYLADRTGIMCQGKLVEENYTSTLFRYPRDEYTKKLLSSIPILANQ